MSKAFSLSGITLVLVSSALLVSSCGKKDDINETTILAMEMQISGLCANSLDLLEKGENEKLERLLRITLKNSLKGANEHRRAAKDIDIPIPNLMEGMSRAKSYCERHGMENEARAAEKVLIEVRRVMNEKFD